ncbi:MAG: Bug family tripartite tricarboxylate transporter substrate binding protein [Xanthobacteraceae bacterium]
MRSQIFAIVLGVAASVAVNGGVAAQTYPTRTVTMVVPFPAGGSTDNIGRILAEGMRGPLGQSVVIENVGGASGNIGAGRVARATPDGYTFVLGSWPTHVLNAAIFKLSYSPLQDFEPVALVAAQPLFIVGRKTLVPNTLTELIAWLKANPGQATQGTAGTGGASHIAGVFFQRASGTQYQMIPFRGSAPAMQNLMAGQIDMMIDLAASASPHVKSGVIKTYAITSKTRLATTPDVPTVDEAGLPGFYVSSWHAVWVPKGTPRDVIEKLNSAVVQALADPQISKRLADVGQDVFPRDQQTPEALRSFHVSESEKWWPIVKAANIKAQ